MSTVQTAAAPPMRPSKADIADWRPEDNEFWESTGKRIAYRNLAISVPALLCALRGLGHVGNHHRADARTWASRSRRPSSSR